MATGKTHSRWARVLVDEIDLSGDARDLGEVGITFDEEEAFGLSDGVKSYTLGHPQAMFGPLNAIFNNTATTGSHAELSAREEYIVSAFFGIRAEPTAGDPAWASPMEQMSYAVAGSGPVAVTANFPGPGQGFTIPDKVWGNVLSYNDALTINDAAEDNSAAVDNGASSANGAIAYLHVTAASAAALTIKVEDSADDITYSDLITFTADGTSTTAEQGTASGTVDRYTRLTVVNASGAQRTITVSAVIIRL